MKSPQIFFRERSRRAESEFEVKNLKIWHPDLEIKEEPLKLKCLTRNPYSPIFRYYSLLGPIDSFLAYVFLCFCYVLLSFAIFCYVFAMFC